MRISQISTEAYRSMTPMEKWELVCGGIADGGSSCDVALLLGSNPDRAAERAKAAAELWREERVKRIVPSGGVKWDIGGVSLSECELMTRILTENGVPTDAIIPENEARTTRENMICGTLAINRRTRLKGIDRVMIITSVCHMRRSLALANAFLPRKLTPVGYPVPISQPLEEWLCNEENIRLLDNEIRLLAELTEDKVIEDMEVLC